MDALSFSKSDDCKQTGDIPPSESRYITRLRIRSPGSEMKKVSKDELSNSKQLDTNTVVAALYEATHGYYVLHLPSHVILYCANSAYDAKNIAFKMDSVLIIEQGCLNLKDVHMLIDVAAECAYWTRFQVACSLGCPHVVSSLLSSSIDKYSLVNYPTTNGVFPIFLAAGSGCLAVVDMLVKLNADICKLDSQGRTVVHVVAAASDSKILKALGAHPDFTRTLSMADQKGDTPMNLAIRRGDYDCVKFIHHQTLDFMNKMKVYDEKKDGFDIIQKAKYVWTRHNETNLLIPSVFAKCEIVVLRNAIVSTYDASLASGVRKDPFEEYRMMCSLFASPFSLELSPLMMSIRMGNLNLLRGFLECSGEELYKLLTFSMSDGKTPLDVASLTGDPRVIHQIVQKLNKYDKDYQWAVDFFQSCGNVFIVLESEQYYFLPNQNRSCLYEDIVVADCLLLDNNSDPPEGYYYGDLNVGSGKTLFVMPAVISENWTYLSKFGLFSRKRFVPKDWKVIGDIHGLYFCVLEEVLLNQHLKKN